MPKLRFSAGRRLMSTPFSISWPAVASRKPARIISKVVLPEPDGPSRVRNSPWRMSRSMPSRAVKCPYCFLIPWALSWMA
ncbi:hypothetical protein D3C72_2030010 [compost metagenome]